MKRNAIATGIFVVMGCIAALSYWLWSEQRYTPTAQQIYDQYYAHFYTEYRKTLSDYEARYYADHYADYYARYYSSDSYDRALNYALPRYTDKALQYPATSPVAHYSTDHQGLELIKYFEGFRAEPYQDVGGKLTIGYGHLIRRGQYYTSLTQHEAEALLRQDVALAEAVVKRYVKVPLRQSQFSALVSLVYNIGARHFKESTLLKKLNQKDYAGAANEFLRWNKVGQETIRGLQRRRAQERALFLS